jgi:hypothetical protein
MPPEIAFLSVEEPQTTYVHGFGANDWLACWNMHLAGTLTATDFAGQVDPGLQAAGTWSVRDLSMAQLRDGPFQAPLVPSHRLVSVMVAAAVRAGHQIVQGQAPHPSRVVTEEEKERILRIADRELMYEEVRREVAPDSASRLACIWLAEDNVEGRNLVWRLKGNEAFVLTVRVLAATRCTRVDTRWLEGNPKADEIRDYWSGEAKGENPLWEFLLEGTIACVDDDELVRLRQHVANTPPGTGLLIQR